MSVKSTPEPELESPIPFGPVSNGEVPPPPRTRTHDVADELYRRVVDEKSRRLGISRRAFIESSCGTVAALWVASQVSGCGNGGNGGIAGAGGSAGGDGTGGGGGSGGGGFTRDAGYDVSRDLSADEVAKANADTGAQVPADAMEDPARADALVSSDDFVFDVQVHNNVPVPPWNASVFQNNNPRLSPTAFLREIFVASDTSVACLSGYPSNEPSIEARDGIRRLMDMVHGSPRLLFHCNVNPNGGMAALEGARRAAMTYKIAAWKTYPNGGRLDMTPAFFQQAASFGPKIICSHRGLGGGPGYDDPYSPRDVVGAAKMFPDWTFLVYHSGYDGDAAAPYNDANPVGVDRLIKAMKEFGIGPNGNVYAELGSTWRAVMLNNARATHLIGKLLLHVGPDRVLWGTDSLNVDNPSMQLAAFRAFQMSPAISQMFGYPALTPEVKRKILGLNGARVYGVDPAVVRKKVTADDLSQIKLAYRADPRSVPMSPHRPHGPRTWREYLGFRKWSGEPV